eukprot:1160551-Pleurochrysis_carterae.AAC.1
MASCDRGGAVLALSSGGAGMGAGIAPTWGGAWSQPRHARSRRPDWGAGGRVDLCRPAATGRARCVRTRCRRPAPPLRRGDGAGVRERGGRSIADGRRGAAATLAPPRPSPNGSRGVSP